MDRYIAIQEIERKKTSYTLCQRDKDNKFGLIKTRWLIPSGFVDQNGYAILMASNNVNDIRIMWVEWFENREDVK